MVTRSALHLHPPTIDLPLLAVVLAGALISAVLLGLALAAFTRRRSRPYLLIVLAIGALFTRTAVAGFAVFDVLSATEHHLLEHALDVAMAALVIAAVYYARTVDKQLEKGEGSS